MCVGRDSLPDSMERERESFGVPWVLVDMSSGTSHLCLCIIIFLFSLSLLTVSPAGPLPTLTSHGRHLSLSLFILGPNTIMA